VAHERAGVEPRAFVGDRQRQRVLAPSERHRGAGRAAVPHDVLQRFLRDR
jgi:hypothetical protein